MSRFGDLDVNEVASRNRKVDLAKLREVDQMVERLRETGVSGKGFDLTPPFRRPTQRPMPVRRRRTSSK